MRRRTLGRKHNTQIQNKSDYHQKTQQKKCPVHWTLCEIIKTRDACQWRSPFQKRNDRLVRQCLLELERKAIKTEKGIKALDCARKCSKDNKSFD